MEHIAATASFISTATVAGTPTAASAIPDDVPCASSLHEAIQWTVAYGSIFDFPLTRDEVHRFLIAPGGTRAEVEAAIDDELSRGDTLETDGQFLYPSGQCALVATRLHRGHCAREAWTWARRYARLIWMLPFVRMVAVTGSLAMDNVERGDDIDLMIVTETGRLWMTRAMILVVVRLARLRGDTLCPNYILSARALTLGQRDFYAAHELAQMAPLYGRQAAERFWAENAWCTDYLPNARRPAADRTDDAIPAVWAATRAVAERALRFPPGTWIERWEQKRKIARLLRDAPPDVRETLYTPDVCKGHVAGHGSKVMNQWRARLDLSSEQR